MKEETTKTERLDKRNQKRFTKRCEVEFVFEGVTLRGITGNFSLTGLFIRTNHPPAPDTVLDLLIFLPNETTSKLRVKVIRSYKTRIGNVMGTPIKSGTNGMGVRIVERDANYLNFFKSMLDYRPTHEDGRASSDGGDGPSIPEAKDGKKLNPMDVVAVLTKVVKQQQKSLDEHKKVLDVKSLIVKRQQETLERQQKILESLAAAVARLEAEVTSLKNRGTTARP